MNNFIIYILILMGYIPHILISIYILYYIYSIDAKEIENSNLIFCEKIINMYIDSLDEMSKEKWYTKSELDDLNHLNKKCKTCLTELIQIEHILT